MQKYITLSSHNLKIINFNNLLADKISSRLIDELHKFGLLKKPSLKNKDTKNLFYHYTVLAICEEILTNKNNNKIVMFFSNSIIDRCELLEYFNEEELIVFFEILLRKLKNILPLRFYITNHTFDYLGHLISKNSGKLKDIIMRFKMLIDNNNIESYTFEKAKKFAIKNKLTFLSDIYFDSLKTKQLLIF